jgi:hypothetical protein
MERLPELAPKLALGCADVERELISPSLVAKLHA